MSKNDGHQIMRLLLKAMQLSERVKEAQLATSNAHDLQMGDEAEATNAWNDLYKELVNAMQSDPIARESKLGQAILRVGK